MNDALAMTFFSGNWGKLQIKAFVIQLFYFPRIVIKRALMNFDDVCFFHKYEQNFEVFCHNQKCLLFASIKDMQEDVQILKMSFGT